VGCWALRRARANGLSLFDVKTAILLLHRSCALLFRGRSGQPASHRRSTSWQGNPTDRLWPRLRAAPRLPRHRLLSPAPNRGWWHRQRPLGSPANPASVTPTRPLAPNSASARRCQSLCLYSSTPSPAPQSASGRPPSTPGSISFVGRQPRYPRQFVQPQRSRAIVWVQGESDAQTQSSAQAYLANLTAFFRPSPLRPEHLRPHCSGRYHHTSLPIIRQPCAWRTLLPLSPPLAPTSRRRIHRSTASTTPLTSTITLGNGLGAALFGPRPPTVYPQIANLSVRATLHVTDVPIPPASSLAKPP